MLIFILYEFILEIFSKFKIHMLVFSHIFLLFWLQIFFHRIKSWDCHKLYHGSKVFIFFFLGASYSPALLSWVCHVTCGISPRRIELYLHWYHMFGDMTCFNKIWAADIYHLLSEILRPPSFGSTIVHVFLCRKFRHVSDNILFRKESILKDIWSKSKTVVNGRVK